MIKRNKFNSGYRRWKIEDWAGNCPFGDVDFKTFQEGWSFIHEKIEDDELLDEYFVVLKWGNNEKN
tara:strand:- start:26 stop:223 length:198 start_codon:yes stop_codon:yes gene_type:complete